MLKRSRLWLALGLICATPIPAAAIAPQHREKIEWTWTDRPDAIDPALPDVLLVGDSITRNYYPFVARALGERANVFLFSTSASVADDRLAPQIADYARMIGRRFTVVHFNNGMHGWGYAERDYASELPSFVAALRAAAPDARLLWASTTPVRVDIADGATNVRIEARNTIAARIMAHASIPIDDQHGLMAGRTGLYQDDIHYGPDGAAVQGAAVAAAITALLNGGKSSR